MAEVQVPQPVNPEQVRQALGATFLLRFNDDAGTVTVVCPSKTGPELQAAIDAIVYDASVVTPDETLRQQAHDSLTDIRTSIDTLQAITAKTNADIGPADTKAVARETRRVARQVLAVSRLLLGALDSTDTGSA